LKSKVWNDIGIVATANHALGIRVSDRSNKQERRHGISMGILRDSEAGEMHHFAGERLVLKAKGGQRWSEFQHKEMHSVASSASSIAIAASTQTRFTQRSSLSASHREILFRNPGRRCT
jgi:hypothetical protein